MDHDSQGMLSPSKGLSENKVVMFLLRVGVELRGNRSGYSLTGPKDQR